MGWQEIVTAISLVLLIEGLIPFISPNTYRIFIHKMSKLNDDNLRIVGLVSIMLGLIILFLNNL